MKSKLRLGTMSFACACALSMALVGCGGNATPAETQKATTETTTQQVAEPVKESFVGTWKFAGAEREGVRMYGDISSLLSMIGFEESVDLSITFADGGTGTLSMGDEAKDFTWTEQDASTAKITIKNDAKTEADGEKDVTSNEATATIKDGVVGLLMSGEDQGTLLFSKDGKVPGADVYDISKATDITKSEDIVGTWKLVGANMLGITMQGDAESISKATGVEGATATFKEDGTAEFMGQETKWKTDDSGKIVLDESDGVGASTKLLDGNLVIDLGDAMGIQLFIVMSK